MTEPHWLTGEEIAELGIATPDPVVRYGDAWYFWDETWSRCSGPYKTRKEADDAVEEYAETVL